MTLKPRALFPWTLILILLAGCSLPTDLSALLPFVPSPTSLPPTATVTASNTITSTPASATLTPFQPAANTLTFTPSSTSTPTDTPTLTASFTSTGTGSPTSTPTGTATPTRTNTFAASLTLSPTRSVTRSPTPWFLPSNTTVAWSTFTASSVTWPTATFTRSATWNPSSTSLPTAADTATRTATPLSTFTSAPTWTLAPTNPSGCTPVYNSGFEAQLLVLINNERANVGLSPLAENASLDASARAHSLDQSVNNFLSHTGSDGSSYWDREVRAGYTGRWGGEIIYAGSGSYNVPASAVHWWMNDPPHKALIVADYQDFGAGYVYCSTNSYGGFFTVDFGHR